jgi:hypothetical protein
VGEREGGTQAGGSLLEHDDTTDEGGPEGGARADGEGDEMGQLGGDEMGHMRQRSRSPRWWRSRIPRAAHRGGGGSATLRSTVTHPSATPSRATPTSCSTLVFVVSAALISRCQKWIPDVLINRFSSSVAA